MRTTTPRALYREIPVDPAYVVISGEVVGTFTPLALAARRVPPATLADALAGGPPARDIEREVVAKIAREADVSISAPRTFTPAPKPGRRAK
jgi:hypothetical protein